MREPDPDTSRLTPMTPAPGVRATSHTGHDPMLVAALAAGDLAGHDRDQAIALTTSCADCASLHDDIVAIARATAATPPPFTAPQRDYRLTHADAARLRPTVWRLVGAISTPRAAATRRAGLAFTTLGLVGLLVGNVQLSLGGSSAAAPQAVGGAPAAAPAAPSDATKELTSADQSSSGSARASGNEAAVLGAASGVPAHQPAASDGYAIGIASSAPRTSAHDQASPNIRGAAGGGASDTGSTPSGPTQTAQSNESMSTLAATTEPSRPWNVVFAGAIVLGLVLLVGARIGSRRRA